MERDDLNDNVLDHLLQPSAFSGASSLRQSLLIETTQVLRARRRFARLRTFAGMAACYAAGALTMLAFAWSRWSADSTQVATRDSTPAVAAPDEYDENLAAHEPSALETDDEADANETNLPARVLERLAELAADDEYRAMYRRAGDRYLTETSDIAAAVRCYGLALKGAPSEALVHADGDNWLIGSLKQARLEEFQHANNGG